MLSTDRQDFELLLRQLCAGYDKPLGDRLEAYWKGLAKMSIIEFARVVEFALSEHGPSALPTTKQCWSIRQELRRAPATPQGPAPAIDARDHLLYFANRMFLRHLVNRGGLGSTADFEAPRGILRAVASAELLATRKAVRDVVDWFLGPVREGDTDATPRAFVEAFGKAIARVSPIEPRTLNGWARMLHHPDADLPFAPAMGRELPPEQLQAIP